MPNVTVVFDKDNKDLTKLTINVDDARSTAYELLTRTIMLKSNSWIRIAKY